MSDDLRQGGSRDPLRQGASPSALDLFERFGREAHGRSADDAVQAAFNVIINALRQSHERRESALGTLGDIADQAKARLADHYDSTGRRRGIFPYHQTIILS